MMTDPRVRIFVLVQLILVLLQSKRDLLIQGAPVKASPAAPTTEKIILTGVSKETPANNQALLAEALPENGSETRQARNDDDAMHDALLDIEEKDLLIQEKMAVLGKNIKELQNFIPEVERENIAEQPQDVKDVQMVMKLDPVKEAKHQHGPLVEGPLAMVVEGKEMSSKEDKVSADEGLEAASKPNQYESVSQDGAETQIENNAPENEEKTKIETAMQSETVSETMQNYEGDRVVAQQSNSNAEERKGAEAPNLNDELEEATAIPQIYGSGTLLRPVENYRSENEGDGVDTDTGFVTEDPELLKDNVFTSVLEAEVVTDPYDCMGTRGPLRHVVQDSKFYVDNTRIYKFMEAREICSKYNLVIAEIEGSPDHRTIQNFMSTNNYYLGNGNGGRFFIGLNDIKTEGVFKHADGKNITYQNFLASQPDDNESEDCVTIMKEYQDGPAGEADYDCNKTAHVFCMFKVDTQCYNDSKETKENRKQAQEHGMHLLVNATERAYFVSNYQTTWKDAMKQCDSKQMKLFDMDNIVTMGFFRSILRWERNFFRGPIPTVQYWTSGKFQKSHMTAPIIWHVKPDITESEERGVEKHNASFSFSGIYHWSTKKRRDPGGPHGWRKDLCVSFGFDNNPDAVPFTRNTNCDLPTYFICYMEYPDTYDDGGSEEEKSSTEKPIGEPTNPDDMPVPPEPENETETIELEQLLGVEGRNLNVSCDTNDETDDVAGRNGIIGSSFRWWNGFTVYIDPSYDSQSRKLINTAMDRLRKHLCIPFYLFRRDQRPYGDYVHIRNRGLCHSKIGREGGSQEMSLGNHCLNVGTIMHEIIHALGFWHEQARPDRDRYVNIFWDNIIRNQKHNFYIRNNVATFGVPYNTASIMHYRSWEFSANRRDTILDKNGGKVGSLTLQHTDIQKLRKMYNCQ